MILRRLLGVAGAGLGLFSIVCIFAGWENSHDTLGTKIAVSIFFLSFAIGCAFLARWGFGKPGPDSKQPAVHSAQIREILKVAQASGGEVSLMEVAAETTLSIEESRVFLEELVTEGLAQMDVDEEGVILYRFPDFQYSGTKEPR